MARAQRERKLTSAIKKNRRRKKGDTPIDSLFNGKEEKKGYVERNREQVIAQGGERPNQRKFQETCLACRSWGVSKLHVDLKVKREKRKPLGKGKFKSPEREY